MRLGLSEHTSPIPWLRALGAFAPTDAADRSSLIGNMLILRAPAGEDSFGQVEALVEREHARFIAIGEVRAALPRHRSILRADTEQQLAKPPATKAAEVQQDIDRYLRQHPETAQALFRED